jgi:hypothetical protein
MGTVFNNAGKWPITAGREALTELYAAVIWRHDTIAYVNLAELFAWAGEP